MMIKPCLTLEILILNKNKYNILLYVYKMYCISWVNRYLFFYLFDNHLKTKQII